METTSQPTTVRPSPDFQARVTTRLSDFPWWLLFLLLGGLLLAYNFLTNTTYQNIFLYLIEGIRLTVTITVFAYALSLILGLLTAFGQLSNNFLIRNIALLYVQLIRGVPIIVQIFYTALVIVPGIILAINAFGGWLVGLGLLQPDNWLTAINVRDLDFTVRGIIAMAISYGAFSSEIFRAGIQSIEKGQIEAAHALGLNWINTMRLVVLPQAIRRILPPLGNDFIAMLKDSSLLSVIGVNEITQLGKKYFGTFFVYSQTLNTIAFLYLSMTLVLSMGVKLMEKRLSAGTER